VLSEKIVNVRKINDITRNNTNIPIPLTLAIIYSTKNIKASVTIIIKSAHNILLNNFI